MYTTKTLQNDDDGGRRKRTSPLSELAERLSYQLRNGEYSPTREELEAVSKCKNEVLMTSLKYPFFFGIVAGTDSWSFVTILMYGVFIACYIMILMTFYVNIGSQSVCGTSDGLLSFVGAVSYRLKVMTRAFNIAVASAFGLVWGRQKAEYACMKHFVTLDESPIKSVLVDILQRDFPDHPLLREVRQRSSSHLEGDEALEYKFSVQRKDGGFAGEARGFSTLSDHGPEYGVQDRDGQPSELRSRSRHMISRRESRVRQRQAPESRELDQREALEDSADVLVDPFSLSIWSEVEGTPGINHETPVLGRQEMRRSRMTSEERREHNRLLREQRESAQFKRTSNL